MPESDAEEQVANALAEENEAYELAKKGLSKAKRSVMTMIKGYTEEDVLPLDVQSGNYHSLLSKIRKKYDEVNDNMDSVLDEIEGGVAEKEVREERIKFVEQMKDDLMKALKENEKKVKNKASTLAAAGHTSREKARPATKDKEKDGDTGDEGAVGVDLTKGTPGDVAKAARFKIMMKQIKAKSTSVRKAATHHAKPEELKQSEVLDKMLESKEWTKKVEEIQKMVDTFEQEGAMLGLSLEDAVDTFDEA